ncbi:MAG: lipid-A-disaccharide synthase [Porticoccaceae bacterium]|nr:lipid-A-disaccharide synthase [Porticoccaceae bacterium]OUS10323.1 lipid-A-disaccharide synthase [Gammaproteobacteria bacterium 54_18_T64]
MTNHPLRIGLVVGEASGDQLGAGLMAALQTSHPDAIFEGVAGTKMQALGCTSLYPMETLSVMGLVEPLKRLPELLRMRRGLVEHFIDHPPDVFIGIDAPDFNLGIELRLKKAGIATVHYVSPSVWAWRQGRIKKIARAVDHMLTLLPFEADFYRRHAVPVTFVGHHLADDLPLTPDTPGARAQLNLPRDGPVIALLPGSRNSEVALLGQLFLDAARLCLEQNPSLSFVLPAANPARRQQLDAMLCNAGDLPVTVLDGQSHLAMEAADVVLLASGTTALEAMLLKKPMVVSYKTGWLTHAIISRMLKVPYVSLPNLLAGRELVPEVLQDAATAETLAELLLARLGDSTLAVQLRSDFTAIHRQIQCNGNEKAAAAVLSVITVQGRSD